MYSEPTFTQPINTSSESGQKNILIIVLLIILVLSLLGVNVFTIVGNWVQSFIDIFNPVVAKGLSNLGYASGNIIDKSSDIAADASKTGIDILNGTFQSIADLLIKSSGKSDVVSNQPSTIPPAPPSPTESTNPVVSSSSATNKSKWCLVGEYNGTRGCISVSDQDKCLSGQVFPSHQMCLNPNLYN